MKSIHSSSGIKKKQTMMTAFS